MRKSSVLAAFAAVIMTGAIASSDALAGCQQCYRKEIAPAQYRTVQQTVMVSPGRVIPHRVPARFGSVQETVMISPPQKAWERGVDAYGRETLCLVKVPARYGVATRTVMVEPPRVVTEMVPAQYATVERTEMVAPAQAYWARVRHGGRVSSLY